MEKSEFNSEQEKISSSSEERKIYPLTGEIIDRGEEVFLRVLEEELKKQGRASDAQEIPRL